MKIVCRNPRICKSISIVSSKSYANRAIIRATLEEKSCVIRNLPKAKDTLTLIQCLRQIGIDIRESAGQIVVANSFPQCESLHPLPIKLETGDGGTTNRFLIPLLALGKNEYHFHPCGKMMERPMDEFRKHLKSFEKRGNYFKVKGSEKKKPIQVDCSTTTQIASAFMLVGHRVQLLNACNRSPYLSMTEDVIKNFATPYSIMADWSSAAFPIAFAVLAGTIQINNLKNIDSSQADSSILQIIEQIGAYYHFSVDGLTVKRNLKRPFQWDCSLSPDLFPVLTFLASYLEGESILKGFANLKHKESNRLSECIYLLDTFGVPYQLKQNVLVIKGRLPDNEKKNITTARDHRIVMLAYLFLRLNGGGTLNHANEVAKSFPEFFNMMQ